MPPKRLRTSPSSSPDRSAVLNRGPAADIPWNVRRSPASSTTERPSCASVTTPGSSSLRSDQPRPSLFTLSSPEDVPAQTPFVLCLNACYHCKRKIEGEVDIFMYRSHAFCSSECREHQIGSDGFAGILSQRPNRTRTMHEARKYGNDPQEGSAVPRQ